MRIVLGWLLFQRHLVERAPRWFCSDARVDVLGAELFERDQVGERFRARLDAELTIRVANRKMLPVYGGYRDGELLGIDLRELKEKKKTKERIKKGKKQEDKKMR